MPEEIESTEEVVDTTGLDDLIDWPAEVPEQEEQQTEDEGRDQNPDGHEEQEQDQADSEEEKPEPEIEQTDDGGDEKEEDTRDTYKYKGKEYTWEELSANPKLRQDIFTAANQQSNYQKLHGENKETIKSLEQQLQEFLERDQQERSYREQQIAEQRARQQAEQAAANAPRVTPDMLNAQYETVREDLKKDGWLEEDIVDLYPNAATGVLAMRDELYSRLAVLENALSSVLQETSTSRQKTAVQTTMGTINSHFDSLAAQGGIFEPLKDQETRINFLKHLRDTLNPPVQHLVNNPDILRDAWVGHNHQALIESVEKAKRAESRKIANDRRLASGEGGGSRPSSVGNKSPIPGEAEGWADL